MDEPQSSPSTVTPLIEALPSAQGVQLVVQPVGAAVEPLAVCSARVASAISEIVAAGSSEAATLLAAGERELAGDLSIRVALLAWDLGDLEHPIAAPLLGPVPLEPPAEVGLASPPLRRRPDGSRQVVLPEASGEDSLVDRHLYASHAHPLTSRLQLARALSGNEEAVLVRAQSGVYNADPAERSELALWVAEAWQLGFGKPAPTPVLELVVASEAPAARAIAQLSRFSSPRIAELAAAAAGRHGPGDQRAEAAALLLDGGGDPQTAALLCARAGIPELATKLRCLDLAIEARLRGGGSENLAQLWGERAVLVGELSNGALDAAVCRVLALDEEAVAGRRPASETGLRPQHGARQAALAALAESSSVRDPHFGPLYLRMRSLVHAISGNDAVAATVVRQHLAGESPCPVVAACHAARAAMSLEALEAEPASRRQTYELAVLADERIPSAGLAAVRDRAWLRMSPDVAQAVAHLEQRGGPALRWAAQLAERRMFDLPRATALWARIAKAATLERTFAFDHLATCHRRARDLGALAETYGALAAREDTARGAAVWRCASGALAFAAGDLAAARQLFERAAEAAPRDLVSRLGLLRVCTELADWGAAAKVLQELRARLTLASLQRRYTRELAIILDEHLQRSDEAERAFEQMLAEDPLDAETMVALGDLYERRQKPMLAIAAKRRAVDLLPSTAAKVHRLLQVAVLCQKHHELEDGLAALELAQQLAPEDVEVPRLLAELYEQLGRGERAVVALRAELARDPAPARRIEVQLRLAALLTRLDSDPDSVVAAYLDVLSLEPDHAEALANIPAPARKLGWWDALVRAFRAAPPLPEYLEVLAQALEKMSSWSELARVRSAQVDAATDALDKSQRAADLANLYEQHLDDADAAIRAFTLARALAPEGERAGYRDRLVALLERQQRWAELAELYQGELVATSTEPPEVRVGWLLRLARLRSERLQELEGAAVICQEVLAIAPAHPEALQLLESLYQGLGKSHELARVLRLRADSTEVGARSAVLARLANTYVASGDIDAAVMAYQAAIEVGPSDRDVFTAYERLCFTRQRWADVLRLYDVAIAHVEGGAHRAYRLSDLYARKAQVQAHHLSDLAGAIEALSKLVALDGDPTSGANALEELCAAAADYAPLVAAFERRAAATRDPARRADALRRAAVIAGTHLDDPERVAELRKKVLALDPGDANSAAALETYYRERKDVPGLIELLRMQLAISRDQATTIGLLQRIAEVSEEEARDVEGAISHYLKILDLEPAHLESLEALGRIYESTERWVELIEVTRRQIKGMADRNSKALLYFRCGSVMEAKFGREEDAIRYYEAAIKVSSACMPAIHGLRDLYRRREDWSRVVDTLELEVKLWQEDKERAGVLAQIGQVYAERLGDTHHALQYYQNALMVDPDCVPANGALFEHYYATAKWAQALPLATALTQKAMRDGDPATRSEFYRKRGEVSLRTGDPKAAADSFVVALEIRPMNLEALDALGSLVREHHEVYDFESTFRELERIYRRRDDATPLLARVWVGLGALTARSGDLDSAGELYAAAIDLAPADLAVLTAVVDFHRDMRQWSAAVEAIEAFLPRASAADQTRARLQQAEIHADGEVDALRAIAVLREVARLDPSCQEAYYLLAQQYFLHSRFAEARAAIDRTIEMATGPGAAVSATALARYTYYAGRILDAGGDAAAAIAHYQRASEHDPTYAPPALLLARKASEAGDHRQAEALLIDAARAAIDQGGPVAAVPMQRGLARILLATGERAAAIEAYRGILNVTPGNASDRVALAEIYAVEDLPRAIAELRKVIDRDIHHAPAYRLLASFYARTGETERAGRVLAALDLLGFAEDSDRSTAHRMRAVRLDTPPVRALDHDHRYHLLATRAMRDVLGELWNVLAAEVTAMFPSPYLGENLTALAELEDPALEADYAAVAGVFAVSAEVFVGDQVPGMAMVVAYPRALIVLDRSLLSEGRPGRRFLFGWALDAIRGGYALLLSLGAGQRRQLSQLLRSLFASDAERSATAAELVRADGGRAAKVLERYVGRVRDLDVSGWMDGMQAGAKRAGLLACDDFAAAIWMIARLSGEALTSHHAMIALGAVLGGSDLVRYYLSDDYQRLRDLLTTPAVAV